MKAVRVENWGGPEAANYTETARPVPSEGELLIKVAASSINPVDWKTVRGYLSGAVKLPATPGWDVAGTVEEMGSGVNGYTIGEPVYAMIHVRGGAFAEYAVVKQAEVAKKPNSLTLEQAAAVPLGALTAWQALFDVAKLTKGQSILVLAAAGGVGSFAVQLAHNVGARVIGTASAKNADFVRSLGADEVIDYTTTRFEDVVKDVDVVLDAIGGESLERAYGVVKKGGILTTIVDAVDQAKAESAGIRAVRVGVTPNTTELTQIAELIDSGKIKVEISDTLPLSEIQKALQLSLDGHIRGKLVLVVD